MLCTAAQPAAARPSASHDDVAYPVEPDDLRTIFALAMSAMYRAEVPLYGDLVNIVQEINVRARHGFYSSAHTDDDERVVVERHGAIRLGTAKELRTVSRIFGLMGMRAVDYYDLSIAGLPMHATAFRPTKDSSLKKNPFRVFTSVLRPELLESEKAKTLAMKILERRNIFTPCLIRLLDHADRQGGRMMSDKVELFVHEALATFRWQPTAAATYTDYLELRQEHPILADIACFRSAHINHLTPRVLDIGAAHGEMRAAGMAVKGSIEGPPRRQWPVLLRQTSFLALHEPVSFPTSAQYETAAFEEDRHSARFGEIEQRGMALTRKGHELYNRLLQAVTAQSSAEEDAQTVPQVREEAFSEFPDTLEELRSQRLVYCEYSVHEAMSSSTPHEQSKRLDDAMLDTLIDNGIINVRGITYEDFLPFSAAGIFESNLGWRDGVQRRCTPRRADQSGFERALGQAIVSSDKLYRDSEMLSLERCATALGMELSIG